MVSSFDGLAQTNWLTDLRGLPEPRSDIRHRCPTRNDSKMPAVRRPSFVQANIRVIAILAAVHALPAAGQTLDDALEAYKRADHMTAVTGFRKHAERGNAHAQSSLGFMYQFGLGIPQGRSRSSKLVPPRCRTGPR